MEGMRAGLLRRLRRALKRVEEQHRALREVAIELDRAVASGSRESVDAWLTRMRDGLVAHFQLEEEVVFPALHGLDPEALAEIQQLERDHGRFLAKLAALIGRTPDSSALAPRDLKGMRERLAAHEMREEHLLARALGDGSAGEE
jgi:iron-sulfur cluster repair protein YtfE (RIC family)